MSEPEAASPETGTSAGAATTSNTAASGATVGIQAEHVHNSTVYQMAPGASPQEKYQIGVRYLDHGVPSEARELISSALAHGYDNAEVRFHWVLAMLSKRSYRDLSLDERERLSRTTEAVRAYADDKWKGALEVICELLDYLNDSGGDPEQALKSLADLETQLYNKIVRHLDLVLTGGVKEVLWAGISSKAEEERLAGDRVERVWAYFHPDPIDARVRRSADNTTTYGDKLYAVACSGLLAAAAGYFGWSVMAHAAPLSVFAYVVAVVAGYVGTRTGMEWRYRAQRFRVEDAKYEKTRPVIDTKFAKAVDRSFTHYFARYVPKDTDRDEWLAMTAGIRCTLRDEVVELYQESKVAVERVDWLVRHLVGDVRKRWESGTLRAYRDQYRIEPRLKVLCSLSLSTLVAAALVVVVFVTKEDPFLSVAAALMLVAGGRGAARLWSRIVNERRRLAEEHREFERQRVARETAHLRWQEKLTSKRPSEGQMEAWLNCDKMVFLDKALRHYQLKWREIIAHAFLQVPASYYKRARVKGGPWRYSKYDVRVFLVTQDGVREISTELDFQRVAISGQDRNNFRFDAVSSVQVTETSELSYTLELTLMNGPARNIRVMDAEQGSSSSAEGSEDLSRINLDAAGFTNTLHILEGIAAEGKNWIERDPHAIVNAGSSGVLLGTL
jgi:hypothetical protein